jgi:hypothetical protein
MNQLSHITPHLRVPIDSAYMAPRLFDADMTIGACYLQKVRMLIFRVRSTG